MDRTLSVSWTKLTLLNENPPPGFLWPGGRLTKIQATTRPDFLLPEMWIGMSKAAKKQGWAVEKPKLDSPRKLRSMYFIDPKDEEHQETF